jgi:hypothetical protein
MNSTADAAGHIENKVAIAAIPAVRIITVMRYQ